MKFLPIALFTVIALACAKPKPCPEPIVVSDVEVLGKYIKDWVCIEESCFKVMKKQLVKE